MKNMILAALAALSMVTLQESAAFVWCDHYALCYSEEMPEDGPEEVYYLLEPLDNGSGNIPF
jgi:hypothetical protein